MVENYIVLNRGEFLQRVISRSPVRFREAAPKVIVESIVAVNINKWSFFPKEPLTANGVIVKITSGGSLSVDVKSLLKSFEAQKQLKAVEEICKTMENNND